MAMAVGTGLSSGCGGSSSLAAGRCGSPASPFGGALIDIVMPAIRNTTGRARTILRLDGAVSALFAVICLAFAGPIDRLLGVSEPGALIGLGAISLLYAAVLFWLTSRPDLRRGEVAAPALLNTAWVVITVVMLATGRPALTPAGSRIVAIIAEGAGMLAVAQWLALRGMRSADPRPRSGQDAGSFGATSRSRRGGS